MAVADRMVAGPTVVAGRPAVSAGGARPVVSAVEAVATSRAGEAMLPAVAEVTRPAAGVGIPLAVDTAVVTRFNFLPATSAVLRDGVSS